MKPSKAYAAPSFTRSIEVLDLLSQHSGWVPFRTIHRTLNLPKSSTYVLLNSMLQNGVVYCDPKRRGYKLGFKLLTIAQRAFSHSTGELLEEAQKVLSQTAREHNENSFFGIINENNEAIYAARGVPPLNRAKVDELGTLIPQYAAIGKALLAWRDEKTVHKIITQNPLTGHTDRAITDPCQFMKYLRTTRRHGFTVNNRGALNNLVGVAAPVFIQGKDAPIGGLSIVSSFEKMNAGFFNKASEYIYGSAKALSEKYGAKDYPEYTPMAFR